MSSTAPLGLDRPMWVALSLAASLTTAVWWARARLVRVDVVGASMRPTLDHGDVVLVRRANRASRGRLRPGRIVVAEALEPAAWAASTRGGSRLRSDRNWVVKRIAAVADGGRPSRAASDQLPELPPGTVFLLGDNRSGSRDSRHVGPWPIERVLGVVMCRLRRAPEPGTRRRG